MCQTYCVRQSFRTHVAHVLLEGREAMCMQTHKMTLSALKSLQQAKWGRARGPQTGVRPGRPL